MAEENVGVAQQDVAMSGDFGSRRDRAKANQVFMKGGRTDSLHNPVGDCQQEFTRIPSQHATEAENKARENRAGDH